MSRRDERNPVSPARRHLPADGGRRVRGTGRRQDASATEGAMSKKHRERYVGLRYWMLQSRAWRSLPGNARALYIELAARYNGGNNGRIPYSVREAKAALHISRDTASHLLGILQARGFLVCTKRG